MTIRFGSVCSGIEAASVAWEPLGWKAAWLSEIEPAPRAVLSHHYPDVPLHGDFTVLRNDPEAVSDIDILVGGTPCQSFSVAGLRQSLADDRGNLTLEFVRLADAIDDVRGKRGQPGLTVVWENVPGVLSTKDNAFGCFLAALVGADAPIIPPKAGLRKRWKRTKGGSEYFCWPNAGLVVGPKRSAAWAIKDAQYFGLAQRRERVFVVANPRNGADPSAILFEPEGVRRHSAPRREEGASVTQALTRSLGAGGADDNRAQGGFYVPQKAAIHVRHGLDVGPGHAEVTALSVALRGRDGGGTNSTAMLIGMVERGEPAPYLIMFADTGGERPETYEYADIFSAWLIDNDYPPVTIVRKVDKNGDVLTLEQNCLNKRILPSIAYGFKTCSQKYKIQPQDKRCNNDETIVREWAMGRKVVKLIGYDADEPQRAKDYADDKYAFRYPLLEWDWGRDECKEAISRAGLPQPGKSSCFFCPNMRVAEIRELGIHHPGLLSRALAMEANADLTAIKGLGRGNFSWEDVVAQGDLFSGFLNGGFLKELGVMPCGCYDGDGA